MNTARMSEPAAITPANNTAITQQYTLYPNPNNGDLTFTQEELADGKVAVKVMNAVGEAVYDNYLDFSGGTAQMQLPNVASGMYIVELKDAKGQRFTTKMVVEK